MYKISIPHDGLGDVLTYTAICRHLNDLTIYLKNEKYKFLFDELCREVIIDNNVEYSLNGFGSGHYTKKKLRLFGIETDDIIPSIKVSQERVLIYNNILSKYENPIVFVSNCSKQWKNFREFKNEKIVQEYLNKLSEYNTILHFGVSSNFTEFKNTVNFVDLSLKDVAACYSIIKKYIGVDTGDYHLMLACGGNAEVYIPDETGDYIYENWHYMDRDRVVYKKFVSLNEEVKK